jgi:hypothetical protein
MIFPDGCGNGVVQMVVSEGRLYTLKYFIVQCNQLQSLDG